MAADYAWPMLGMWICQRSCYHGTAGQDPRIICGVVGQEIWGSLVTESQVACDKDNKSTQNPHKICKVHDTSHDTKPCVRNPKSAQKHSMVTMVTMVTMPPTWVSTSQQKPQWNEQKDTESIAASPTLPTSPRDCQKQIDQELDSHDSLILLFAKTICVFVCYWCGSMLDVSCAKTRQNNNGEGNKAE